MTDLFANRYQIEKELGRGSFGVVFLAYDTRLRNRPVALKVLHAALNNDPATVSRFHSEAGILASLEHDHIVPAYDVDVDQGTRFIVMKYVPGPTLAAILKNEGAQTPERVLVWLEQIAKGLDHAHSRGVLHRDLKPSNILLDEERNRIVISDFGLAKAVQASGGSSVSQSAATMTGTAYYMAPEVIKGEKHTAASDLYSLGCVLYELLSGERPFEGENFIAVTSQAVLNPTPTLALSGDMGELLAGQVAALMAKEPEARPQSAGLVYGSVVEGRAKLEAARQAAAARLAQETEEAQRAEAARQAELERQRQAAAKAKQEALKRQQRKAEQARLAELERQKRAAEAALAAERARIEAVKEEEEKKGAWWRSPLLWAGATVVVIIAIFLIWMVNSQNERNASATATAIAIAAVTKTAEVTPTEEPVIVVPTDTPIPPTLVEPPTVTPTPPTNTPVPDTPTPQPAADTPKAPPTDTPIPPTDTPTLISTETESRCLAFIAEENNNWSVMVVDTNGNNLRDLHTGNSCCPRWSPNGNKIAYRGIDHNGNHDIYVINGDGTGKRRLTTDPGWDWAPDWSPDGQEIVFVSNRDGQGEIYIMNADGTGQRNISQSTFAEWDPAWSPDGNTIVFPSNRSGSFQIWSVNPDGSSLRQITDLSGDVWGPSWSPDGNYLTFYRRQNGIWLMKADGTDLELLYSYAKADTIPEFSPDRKHLVFWASTTGRNELYQLDLETSIVNQVTSSGASQGTWCH